MRPSLGSQYQEVQKSACMVISKTIAVDTPKQNALRFALESLHFASCYTRSYCNVLRIAFAPHRFCMWFFQIWLRLLLVLFCGVSTIKVPNALPFALWPIYSASGLRNVYKMADMDAICQKRHRAEFPINRLKSAGKGIWCMQYRSD